MIYFYSIGLIFLIIFVLVFIQFESSEEKAMEELMEIQEKTTLLRNAKKHSQKKFKRKC